MAENKKSFLIYCDILHSIDHLTNEEKGILFQHLLEYVNDMNPVLEDRLVLTAWKPIERQLKRDLQKYEEKRQERSNSGKLGNLKKYNIDLYDKVISEEITLKHALEEANTRIAKHSDAKLAVNVNVNVNDKDTNTNVLEEDVYDKVAFIKDWNELRTIHLKKPSHLNSIPFHDLNEFSALIKENKREDFRNAMIGLFKQKKLPNDSTSMQSNPSHFLKFFNSYLTAYHDTNDMLYGKKE